MPLASRLRRRPSSRKLDGQSPASKSVLAPQVNKLTLVINRPTLSAEDIKKLEQAQRNNKTSE